MDELKKALTKFLSQREDKVEAVNEVKGLLHEYGIGQPVDLVQWIKLEDVEPNDYNPNAVASIEMSLLYRSIKHDGFTQPIVAIYDPKKKKYIIVDGFHRYYVAKTRQDIVEATQGYLPITVLDKDINERMAATVRHNRARGEHSITGMGNLVYKMLENGKTDEEICNELGMQPEEILKLKHITGFSKLFDKVEYNQEWKSRAMIRIEKELKMVGNDDR